MSANIGNIGSNGEVEKWKVRHFLKTLKEYRGTAPTGLITLPIPPGTQLPLVIGKLQHEYGTATNIKSHSTTLAVQAALTTAIQRLKLYRQVPSNGLILYAGNAYLNGKEKRVCLDIEGIKPVCRKDYYCSNKFDVSHLEEMLEDSQVYGFVIMDGNGCLMAKVQGAKQTILASKDVEMPKKHKKGGQSSQRFQRIRLEKRDAYIKIACELCTSCFIDGDKPNVSGLIVAGSSDFKNKLSTSDHFDQRLRGLIWKVLDISYGGQSGLDQAINRVKDDLAGLPLVKEKQIVNEYFEQLKDIGSKANGSSNYENEGYSMGSKVAVGPEETLSALEAGVIEKILIDEDSNLRYNPEQSSQNESILLTEYLADNYEKLDCQVYYITSNTGEGVQFIKGFRGLGAILKYEWTYYPPDNDQNDNNDQSGNTDQNDQSGNDNDQNDGKNADNNESSRHGNYDVTTLDLDDFFM